MESKILAAEAALHSKKRDKHNARWSEQDQAAQIFLRKTVLEFLNIKPHLKSKIKKKATVLRSVAENLRKQASKLRALNLKQDAKILSEVAENCDLEADNAFPTDPATIKKVESDPGLIIREIGNLRLRSFVGE